MSCGCGGRSTGTCFSTGCSTTVGTECVFYQGNKPLTTVGGTYGERLETLLVNIDKLFQTTIEQVQDGFIGMNVGGGIELYKGLNPDGIGELRTFRSTESIQVSNDDNTIAMTVRESWIDGKLSGASSDISDIKEQVAELQSDVNTLKTNVASNTSDINTLKTDVSSVTQRVTDLTATVTALSTTSNTHTTQISQIMSDILQLQTDVAALKTTFASIENMYSQEFTGQTIVRLEYDFKRIIGVYYNGQRLNKEYYTEQTPNQVALNLASAGLTIIPTDKVWVDYTYRVTPC